jgi:hypothetical protein
MSAASDLAALSSSRTWSITNSDNGRTGVTTATKAITKKAVR